MSVSEAPLGSVESSEPTVDAYVALGNAAGTLGLMLNEYLRTRFNHLILAYPEKDGARTRLEEIATHYAWNSFFYFCRFIRLLDRIHMSEMVEQRFTAPVRDLLRRLENAIVTRVPSGGHGAIDTYAILRELGNDTYQHADAQTVSAFALATKEGKLRPKEYGQYKQWLFVTPTELTPMTVGS